MLDRRGQMLEAITARLTRCDSVLASFDGTLDAIDATLSRILARLRER